MQYNFGATKVDFPELGPFLSSFAMVAFATSQKVLNLFGKRAQSQRCDRSPGRVICRAGRRASGSDKARKGRGRAAKRTALYDAMSEYAEFFTPLLHAELAAEQAAVLAARDASKPRWAQVESGIALFGLRVTKGERVFSNAVFQLRFEDGRRIPDANRFNSGDLLVICVDNAASAIDESEDGEFEVTVLYRKAHRLDIAVPVTSQAFYTLRMLVDIAETVSVFQGTSAIAHERAVFALELLTKPSSTVSPLVKLITKSLAARIVSPSARRHPGE